MASTLTFPCSAGCWVPPCAWRCWWSSWPTGIRTLWGCELTLLYVDMWLNFILFSDIFGRKVQILQSERWNLATYLPQLKVPQKGDGIIFTDTVARRLRPLGLANAFLSPEGFLLLDRFGMTFYLNDSRFGMGLKLYYKSNCTSE